ncbi:glycosyltransferase [Brunnivagina elsteri]|uniref:Nucleotide-diphospho-sugar transferase domain-containing protein n=1 Tax=Brunnivagina elsteri CCALA 953 TaxID=987040 RepID=A0A2A2TC04_9CYAN|nr:glycosyltransferase [Calothrix elsteri]PAX51175.1 hypothetical protein CK510_26230 [Calothrix elsteri CCALA 953]
MTDRGVVYCAMGYTVYLEAALTSALILRRLEPKIPITLISNHPSLKYLALSEYKITPRFVEPTEWMEHNSFSSRHIKTSLPIFSPYNETLFLDADILPLKPISHLWEYLDSGDMCMAADRLSTLGTCNHVSQAEKSYTLEFIPENITHFNSGVILWRNNIQTRLLFELWHQEWLKFQQQDQLALIRAINRTQFPIKILPCTYNISPIDAVSRVQNQSVKLLSQTHNMCQLQAASMLSQENDIYLLHCWGGILVSGKFQQIAQKFYPDIIEQLVTTQLFAS